MIPLLLCAVAVASTDLRVVVAPPESLSDLRSTRVTARVWWSGAPAEVQVAHGGQWKTVGQGRAPVEIEGVFRGEAVRIRLDGAWTAPAYVPRTIGPADLARLSGPPGTMLAGTVGQIAHGATAGTVWASTLGGGLVQAEAGGVVRSWTRWEGLPDDRVLAVSTEGGRVLVGTAGGAALLEGGRVEKLWSTLGKDGHVQAVYLTRSTAWAGTPRGLFSLDPVKELSLGSVYSLAPRGDGGVWVGQGGVRTHGPPGGKLAKEVALKGDHIYAILPIPDGIAVASQEHGVWRSEADGLVRVPDFLGAGAYGLARTGTGLWVAGGASGLFGPSGAVYGYADGLPGRSVWSLLQDTAAESLWVGTDRGLARFSPGPGDQAPRVQTLPLVRWPADEDVGDLLVTRRGLWAAGKRGVWTLGRPHRHAENLVVAGRAGVVALAQGGGHIWAVGARVTRMDRRGRLASTPLRFRPTDAAWSEGSLWISSATGLHRMDPVSMRMDPVLPLAGVTRVLAGHSGIWAVADGIPVRLEGRTPRVFMRARRVRDIAPMVDAVCLGTESGVERLLADGSVVVPAGDSLTGVVVPAVAHDGSGGCWYATDAGKVGRIGADDSHKSLSLEGGEVGWPDRIVPDGDWAWVVTRKGTHRVWLPPSAKP